MTTLTLPWPTSVNEYWRTVMIDGKPRTLISRKGREYRGAVAATRGVGAARFGEARVSVEVVLCGATRRKFDIDNFCKGIFDGLTFAGVWDDDSQVDRLTIIRGPVTPGGAAIVTIRRVEAQP